MEPKKSFDKLVNVRDDVMTRHAKSDIEIERLIGKEVLALIKSTGEISLDTLKSALQTQAHGNTDRKLTAQCALERLDPSPID